MDQPTTTLLELLRAAKKPTTTISAKSESVEIEPAKTDNPGPANLLQTMAIADVKISVHMYTHAVKTMQSNIF